VGDSNPLLPHTDGCVYLLRLHDGRHLPPQRDAQHPGDGEAVLERLKRNASDRALFGRGARGSDRPEPSGCRGGGIVTGAGVVRGRWRTAECGGGGSSVRAYKDGIDRHNSDGGPDAIRSDVREYQSLWTPDGLEEEQGGTWAMLVAVNAAVQRETAAAPQFLLSSSEAIMVDNNRVLHGREGYAYSGGGWGGFGAKKGVLAHLVLDRSERGVAGVGWLRSVHPSTRKICRIIFKLGCLFVAAVGASLLVVHIAHLEES
jgi:hypothetical protein